MLLYCPIVKKAQLGIFQPAEIKNSKTSMAHGGTLRVGKRKITRPFVARKKIHIVMRSSKAKGLLSFFRPKNEAAIHAILHKQSTRHFVKLHEYVNVGNHLHIKVSCASRENFSDFLISISALIARAVSGAKRGLSFGKFWDALIYTRVLLSKFEEFTLSKYFDLNAFEAKFGNEMRDLFRAKTVFS